MKIPFVLLRITAYHMVEESMLPRTRCHGRGGSSLGGEMPASISCRCVAT
ncbi:MAG: hypothetical protein JWQ18_2708 [Conexibacter sp.]|nr:hypothetical protein [Conexibacter sp.]